MAVKAWFDYETYMSNKLNQMVKAEPQAGWTADSLKAAFEKAGFVGDTGAQEHFLKWGHKEDVSPNKMFDADYYYQAKALAYYTSTEAGSAQVAKEVVLADLAGYGDKMEAIIKGAGMDAWTHYTKYGTKEGINPSNDFDTSNYMAAKIAAMNGTMTADEVYAAFKKAGMNALAHAEIYAGKGGTETTAAANTFVVPEDEQLPTTDTGTALTVAVDNLSGTHFVANPVVNSLGDVKQTLNTNDTLKGTGEDNSLDVMWTATTDNGAQQNGSALVTPNMSNVQTLNLTNNSNNGLLINGKNIDGLTTINISDSLSDFSIEKLGTKIENVSLTGTDTDTTVEMQSSALAGTEDNLNLTVDGLESGASFTTTRGYETVAVTTANNASVVDAIATPAAKSMSIGGDQNLSITGYQTTTTAGVITGHAPLSDTFESIDASAMTGKFVLGSVDVRGANTNPGAGKSAAFTSKAEKVTIKTGSADDTLYIGDLDKNYTIDTGEGSDTLYVTGDVNTQADPKSVTTAPSIKGVETIGVVAGNGQGVKDNVTLELKGVEGVTGLILGAQGADDKTVTLRNMTHDANQDFTITAVGDGTDTVEFNGVNYSPYGTVADKAHLTMNISNQGKNADIKTGALDFGKVENVDMNVSDIAADKDFDVNITNALETFNFVAKGGQSVNLHTLGVDGSLKAASITSDANVAATISQAGGGVMTLHGDGDFNLVFTKTGNSGMTVDSSDATGTVNLTTVAVNLAAAAGGVHALVGGDGAQTLGVTIPAGGAVNAGEEFNFTGGNGADTVQTTAGIDHVIYTAVGQGGKAISANRDGSTLSGGDVIGTGASAFKAAGADTIDLSAVANTKIAVAAGNAMDLDAAKVAVFATASDTVTVDDVKTALGAVTQATKAAGTWYAVINQATTGTETKIYEITLDGTGDYSAGATLGSDATIALLGTVTQTAALAVGDIDVVA